MRAGWRGSVVLGVLAALPGALACGDDAGQPGQGSSGGSSTTGAEATTTGVATDSSSSTVIGRE